MKLPPDKLSCLILLLIPQQIAFLRAFFEQKTKERYLMEPLFHFHFSIGSILNLYHLSAL
ncbi:hypothetical protein protein [Bacillus cereus G9241]|nr:hypothetical protein protein [Bacillus cereus G9241]